MAYVTLTTLTLNNALNYADLIQFPLMSQLSDTPAVGIMMSSNSSAANATTPITLYANGTLRAITQPGEQRVLVATCPASTTAQVNWLYAHMGMVLLVRDDRGRRFWGMYFTYEADEHYYDLNTDITLTIYEMTYTDQI
jgi:hypothetical protein